MKNNKISTTNWESDAIMYVGGFDGADYLHTYDGQISPDYYVYSHWSEHGDKVRVFSTKNTPEEIKSGEAQPVGVIEWHFDKPGTFASHVTVKEF